MESLWAAGIAQVTAGHTSPGELQRVVDMPFPPVVQSLVRDAREQLVTGSMTRVAERSADASFDPGVRARLALAAIEQFELTEPVPRPR
jgi:hypothetical protein